MDKRGGELQSAVQYQVLSTGLQHGHFLVIIMVAGVQDQQWSMLPLEKQVSVAYISIIIYCKSIKVGISGYNEIYICHGAYT